MRVRKASYSAFVSALACAAAAGCSYDWSVGRAAAASDAGSDAMTQPDADASKAATDADASAWDVGVTDTGPSDSSSPPADGASCVPRAQSLQQAEGPAIACVLGSATACKTSVHDACGCAVWVGDDTRAVTTFTGAVQSFEDAGCSAAAFGLCPTACPTSASSVCLAAEGGASYACYQ